MLWRKASSGDPTAFAVDTEGRLILAQWDGIAGDNVISNETGVGYNPIARSDVNIPALNTWGDSPTKATMIGDFGEFEIQFKGQSYNVTDSGQTFEPELEDYQP